MSTKLMGYVTGVGLASNGLPELRLLLRSDGALQSANELKTGEYLIEFKRPTNKRSLQQNNYLWELIGQIDMKINGSKENDETIYCQMLEEAGQKVTYVAVEAEAFQTFKTHYRLCYEVQRFRGKNGKLYSWVKCFEGSSQFNTEEMSKLIDVALEWAARYGIDADYYKTLLLGDKP